MSSAQSLAYYLSYIMIIKLLFWFLLFYISFKFIIRVVIPVILTTRNVRSKVKEMNENMEGFKSDNTSSANDGTFGESASKTSPSKGDYIDFEEIK